jgi:radical SAM/SPASM domain protein of ACGX system
MGWAQIQHVIENAIDFCHCWQRVPYFYITGGDPILHPHFWDMLKKMRAHEIPFTLMGNPFHLDDDVCRRMRELGCDKYQMSIDGLEKTHDQFRKPGSFKTTLDKISCINKAGITSVIMSTVSGSNIDEIPGVVDAVVNAGADVYAFARYVPTSDSKSSEQSDWYIAPERYRVFLEQIDQIYTNYKSNGCKTVFNRKDHLWTLFDYEHGRFTIPQNALKDMIYGGCNCGNCHITILPNGDVMACRRVANSKVGNVLKDRLADLWIDRKMEKYREFNQFTKCAKCELLPYCRGCPAVAAGYHQGDFYAPDPQCWKA